MWSLRRRSKFSSRKNNVAANDVRLRLGKTAECKGMPKDDIDLILIWAVSRVIIRVFLERPFFSRSFKGNFKGILKGQSLPYNQLPTKESRRTKRTIPQVKGGFKGNFKGIFRGWKVSYESLIWW